MSFSSTCPVGTLFDAGKGVSPPQRLPRGSSMGVSGCYITASYVLPHLWPHVEYIPPAQVA